MQLICALGSKPYLDLVSASASPTEASGGARDSSQIYSEPDKPSRGPPSSGGRHSELADDGYARLTETGSRNIDSLANAEYFHTHTAADTAGEVRMESVCIKIHV